MRTKRILVCDDDPDIVEVTKIILEMEGFEVEALDFLRSDHDLLRVVNLQQPDLVLMDLRIPNIGGVRATEVIKQHASTTAIPVILFSANHTIMEISQRIGADGVVRKPFDIKEIMSVIRELI
mgnify:CR=1 FL=1